MQQKKNIFLRIFNFYYEGFSTMTWGKQVWIVILLKLFIMFAVLKLFFFPDFLKTNFETDTERGNHVIEQLTRTVDEDESDHLSTDN
jgi:hypothetical protein